MVKSLFHWRGLSIFIKIIDSIILFFKNNNKKSCCNFFLILKFIIKRLYFFILKIKINHMSLEKLDNLSLINAWRLNSKKGDFLREELVTIIVPNYNHGRFLIKRLESIYKQTYKNIEVILLDDCSTDNSQDILLNYKKKYPSITRTIFSEKNSGSIFKQLRKGLALAKGKYIWIAESDNWCDIHFIEKLIFSFSDEAIMLAFSRSDFIQNSIKINDTERYLMNIELPWYRSF